MEVKATHKYARISPFKVRDVAREVTGMPVSDALDVIRFTPRKGAFLLGKTLNSAVANATNNHDLDPDELVVKSATVTEGPTLKRWKPRARGGAAPIHKRTSHIRVILTDEPGDFDEEANLQVEVAPKKAAAKKSAPKKQAQSGDSGDSGSGDDLKLISGVGPKLENKLRELGITTYEQIAEWGEDEMADFGEKLNFKDRIQRDDWKSQAKKLIEDRDA